MVAETTKPEKMNLACLVSRTTIEVISISKKLANTNQKVPTSNITPKRDDDIAGEKSAESRKDNETLAAPSKTIDRGISTLPSKNLAAAQKITETATPKTNSSPLEVSTGILRNGKKNTGSKTITKKIATNEIRSKTFDIIMVNIILQAPINIQTNI